jgi:hypothetical protein
VLGFVLSVLGELIQGIVVPSVPSILKTLFRTKENLRREQLLAARATLVRCYALFPRFSEYS